MPYSTEIKGFGVMAVAERNSRYFRRIIMSY